jgi:hypothetical protein
MILLRHQFSPEKRCGIAGVEGAVLRDKCGGEHVILYDAVPVTNQVRHTIGPAVWLEAESKDVVHGGRLSEVGTGDEFSLLSGGGGSIG